MNSYKKDIIEDALDDLYKAIEDSLRCGNLKFDEYSRILELHNQIRDQL